MDRLEGWLTRRRRLVVALWLVTLVAAAPFAARQTEHLTAGGFKVPGYPVTPLLSIVGCLWIILDLRFVTIAVFVVWAAVALAWYFAYGIRHSALRAQA